MAQSRDYRHGYYDCLAGRYDEDRDNHAYREGCRAARREREDEGEGVYGAPGYAPPPQGGFGGPPTYREPYEHRYRPPVAPPNVRGMETAQALSVLAANGYQQVGARGFGAAVVAFYFNSATRGCLQIVYTGRRVNDVQPSSDRSCR